MEKISTSGLLWTVLNSDRAFLLKLDILAVDFFNEICLLYGTVAEECTAEKCPIMSAGTKYIKLFSEPNSLFYLIISFTYLWADGGRFKKPTEMPAQDYIDHLMSWIESIFNDESIFPSSTGLSNFVKLLAHFLFFKMPHSRRTFRKRSKLFSRDCSEYTLTFIIRTSTMYATFCSEICYQRL